MLKIPGYKECLDIVSSNNCFYETKINIDGYDISIFNYRLAQFNDFKKFNAFELRGLTFVFDKFGNSRRFLLLEKFFNLNQCDLTLYDNVKNLEIESVLSKEDGSLATFIKLPNGRVIGKTKVGFDNDQSIRINNIYDNDEVLRGFVNNLLNMDLQPIFEYVSPENRIVLKYPEEKLILLKIRCNKTGLYKNLSDFNLNGINVAKNFKLGLDEMIELSKSVEDIEGWVVNFKGGLTIKIKTLWYFKNHKLITEDLSREDFIIDNILNDTIDDILSQISPDDKILRDKVLDISDKINKYLFWRTSKIDEFFNFFVKDFKSNRKQFAIYHKKNLFFSNVMALADGRNSFDLSKEFVSKKCFRLENARNFLKELDSKY